MCRDHRGGICIEVCVGMCMDVAVCIRRYVCGDHRGVCIERVYRYIYRGVCRYVYVYMEVRCAYGWGKEVHV